MSLPVRYPRMIYKGEAMGRVESRDALLAKVAEGWHTIRLEGETPEDIGEAPHAPPADPQPATVTPDPPEVPVEGPVLVKRGTGRPRKAQPE